MGSTKWKRNRGHDIIKGVAKVSNSVVCLTTTTAGESDIVLSKVNGTIFSCEQDKNSGLFHSFILTSADVLRDHFFQGGECHPIPYTYDPIIAATYNIRKLHVRLHTARSYRGEIVALDPDYNIAVVKIESDVELPTASLMCIDDRVSIDLDESSKSSVSDDLNPNYFKIVPGDELVVVGRRFGNLDPLVYSSGKYSVDYLGYPYDFEDLFRINCKPITNGGPVINFGGNVIGVAFGCEKCTAFLSINDFLKWWKHFRTYKEICRPFLDMRVANLFTAHTRILEPALHVHGISEGVVVEEVERESPAYIAGIRSHDVIYRCGGTLVRSLLQFSELIWNKKGEVVEVMGIRGSYSYSRTMKIDIVKPESSTVRVVMDNPETLVL